MIYSDLKKQRSYVRHTDSLCENTRNVCRNEDSVKNTADTVFFTRLFVSERKQIALMAELKSPMRISVRLFALNAQKRGIKWILYV